MSRIEDFSAMDSAGLDAFERRVRVCGWPLAFALGLALWAGILVLAL